MKSWFVSLVDRLWWTAHPAFPREQQVREIITEVKDSAQKLWRQVERLVSLQV
jgi:hypothetical protein